jgi:hypothetical protein
MLNLTSKAITVCLLLMALAAPLSIAGTQTAWAFGLLFWIIRAFLVRPRPKVEKLDLAIFAFVGLSLISSFFSYEPGVSLRKMVSVSLVTIVYLVATNLKDKTTLRRMIVLLLAGCFIACAYTFGTLAVGKNLKILKMTADSPLRAAGIEENDTILTARGDEINSPYDLGVVFAENREVPITIYRHELINTYRVPVTYRGQIAYDEAYFGIIEWSRGRDTRAAGFFGHYTTFAEALQMLASLTLALLIVVPGGLLTRNRILLGIVFVAAMAALFLSLTRASWLSFVISAGIITLMAASRRTVIICALIAVPLIIGGLAFLQQKRQVGFFDSKDDSTTWRTMVWKEGWNVLTLSPRHLAVGIGMDSLKTHWQDWGMFDNGRQPIGHMHSDYLQIAFERGIPTLIAWLAWMVFYLQLLWKNIRRPGLDWPARGLLIGAFGGTIGFLTSGIVHYNWGDSEVVMIFYLIMGISLAVIRNRELHAD